MVCRNRGKKPCHELLHTMKLIGGLNLVIFFKGERNCGVESVARFENL